MKKIILFVGTLLIVVFLLFSCSVDDTSSFVLEEYDLFVHSSSALESSDTEESNFSSIEELDVSRTEKFEYVLNKSTHKFHYAECRSVKLMKEKNEEHCFTRRNLSRGFSAKVTNCSIIALAP